MGNDNLEETTPNMEEEPPKLNLEEYLGHADTGVEERANEK